MISHTQLRLYFRVLDGSSGSAYDFANFRDCSTRERNCSVRAGGKNE